MRHLNAWMKKREIKVRWKKKRKRKDVLERGKNKYANKIKTKDRKRIAQNKHNISPGGNTELD